MIITYYRSSKFEKTMTESAHRIFGTDPPDELITDDKKMLQDGTMETMCNFEREDETWISIPWKFIISIEEDDE